jgi:hypothetical protein
MSAARQTRMSVLLMAVQKKQPFVGGAGTYEGPESEWRLLTILIITNDFLKASTAEKKIHLFWW